MRNHSHNRRKTAARIGGWRNPNAGRKPIGARNREINPASSSIPSDWYPENSPAALTNERKHTKQISNAARGNIFATTSSDAMRPIQHNAISACDPLENHSKVGAYQKRACPAD